MRLDKGASLGAAAPCLTMHGHTLDDGKWGERVTAVVQRHPGRTVTAAEVRAFVKDRLGRVKPPSRSKCGPTCPAPR